MGKNGITWQKHNDHHSEKYGDLCYDCAMKYKHPEVVKEKYGVDNILKLPWVQEKIAKTNLEKYGAINPFYNSEIKEKIK